MATCRAPLCPSIGEVDHLGVVEVGALVGRQQLIDRHAVEAREPLEPRHRDRALAAFVGAEHRRLELLAEAASTSCRDSRFWRRMPAAAHRPCGRTRSRWLFVRRSFVTHASPLPRPWARPLPSSTPVLRVTIPTAATCAINRAGDLTQRDRAPGLIGARPAAHRRPTAAVSARARSDAEPDAREAGRRARGRTSRPRVRPGRSVERAKAGRRPRCEADAVERRRRRRT